jgi:signal transduction histidine kinase
VEMISEQKKQVKEINITTSDGKLISIINSKALILDNEGAPSGIVGVLLDITEQKESQKLKTNLAQLMQEEKLKTEFFSNISHELRTPLNVIYSAEQIIEMSMNNISDISNQIKIRKNTLGIKQNCLRLLRLVNNLIDITKIDSKAFELRIQNLNIVYVVEEITLSVADFISNKGVHLVFDTDVEEKVMAFDEEKMERIILNLLSNAIKYTPDGGSISVSIFDKVDSILIEIKDSGVGIPKDKLDKVFKRFYQISPINTRSQEGSGIGLNLVKSLVEMHHGEISVNSVLGSGTTFTIMLPCVIQEDDIIQNQIVIDQQSRIEKIQLEFSDIYKISGRS